MIKVYSGLERREQLLLGKTDIDLKRRSDPGVIRGWDAFITDTPPAFFVAWLVRLGSQNHIQHGLDKLKGIAEYANGMGVAGYGEPGMGQYEWIHGIPRPLQSLETLIKTISGYLSKRL